MTLNLPKLIKTLGESLYSDPTVALRELIQNANDTCVHRESTDATHRHSAIHVTFDPHQRLLTVRDNGSGMTWEEAEEFLTVIGNSRTELVRDYLSSIDRRDLADRLIGRFGLGLLSAFIIGDRIEFLTLSHQPGSMPVAWACDGGQDYQMNYSTAVPPVGTTVTVHVGARYVGLLNQQRLTELIRLYADLLQVPIYLGDDPQPVNAIQAPWDSKQSTEADYRTFLQRRFPYDDILEVLPIDVDEDDGDFRIKGVLFIPRQPLYIVYEYGDVMLYVRRMLIAKEDRDLLPPWARFVRGIIDTPSLNEVTSRGSVARDGSFDRVQATLGEIILKYMRTLASQQPLRMKEVATAHNVVLKAWSLVSSELFDCAKDVVLFSSDAGRLDLPGYFASSRGSDDALGGGSGKRLIFYYTTPGGPGPLSVLFSARGLHVIDASSFPDEAFLRRYAAQHPGVETRPVDISGGFVFEELAEKTKIWLEVEAVFEQEQIAARVVQFQPADIPAVFIVPESEPLTEQVDALLNDAGLSDTIKDLIRRMYEERENSRRGKLTGSGTLYVNARNSVIRSITDMDLDDKDIREVLFAVYHNALMLSSQGGRTAPSSTTTRSIFEANNRTISSLMRKIREVRDLAQRGPGITEKAAVPVQVVHEPAIERAASVQTAHVTCFVAIPFMEKYDLVLEALRDVLEVRPYYWEVARADAKAFRRRVSENVAKWIARAHCYVVEISELNGNVMMELGHAYWGFPDRPLLILQRSGDGPDLTDLGDFLRFDYPWDDRPDRADIADALRRQIEANEELSGLRRPGMPRFLSPRLMKESGASEQVAKQVAKMFPTIEGFLAAEPDKVADRIKVRRGIVSELQTFVKEHVAE